MDKNYTQKIDKACKNAPYLSTDKSGKGKGGGFGDYDLTKRLNDLEASDRYFKGFINAFQGMVKDQLEKNGIKGTNTPIGEVYKMFENIEVILKGEEVHAMQHGALGKYVTAFVDATEIYHGELPENFSADGTWFKNDQGVYERDMQKVAELML